MHQASKAMTLISSMHFVVSTTNQPSDAIQNIFTTCVRLFGDPSDVFGDLSVIRFSFPRTRELPL